MATYRIKRKLFGLLDQANETVKGAEAGLGRAMNSNVGGIIGGVAGGTFGGSLIGGALDSMGVPGASLMGPVAGAMIGAKVTRGIGKGLENASQT